MTKKINKDLTSEQKLVLFEEGTEAPGSSKLNHEKREGSYQSLPNVFETKTDHLLGYERTEYHCKKCGGHHGHIFEDVPNPTGKRYCNNGVCLVFKKK